MLTLFIPCDPGLSLINRFEDMILFSGVIRPVTIFKPAELERDLFGPVLRVVIN